MEAIVLRLRPLDITRIGRGGQTGVALASSRSPRTEGDVVSEELDELEQEYGDMGPIEWVLLAWPGGLPEPDGSVAEKVVNAQEAGIIRVLDFALIAKDAEGNVAAIELADLGPDHELQEFDGAASGMLDQNDLEEAAKSLEPDSAAALLVWENRWAAPIAKAIREKGGMLVDRGNVPVQGILAALEALEAAETTN